MKDVLLHAASPLSVVLLTGLVMYLLTRRRHKKNIEIIAEAANEIREVTRNYNEAKLKLEEAKIQLENQSEAFRELIKRVYHKDWFPKLCRAEGLIYLATRENHHRYAELALQEVKGLKEDLQKIIQEYEIYQNNTDEGNV